MISVQNLTVNYLKDPCGVDTLPRFSYQVTSDVRGDEQKSRRIRVYSSKAALARGEADVWDSGAIEDSGMTLIHYEGEKLLSVHRYFYTVDVETVHGEKASAEGTFVTGKLDEKWSAKWISDIRANKTTVSVNGTTYSITGSSNDGAYDTITIDTSVTKTITFATVGTTYRCMVNSITFIG